MGRSNLALFDVIKMNKIGILTYHNNKNRGAILQAYCLWHSLKERIENSEVEIIDYRTRTQEIDRIYSLNPRVCLENLFDYTTCTKFLKNNDALTSKKIITNNHQKAIKHLKKENYDLFVVGSDQIWSYRKNKSKRPFPNAYFLDPSLGGLKASYAASANKMKLDSLSKTERKIYKKHISAFDKISVRDEHTENILKDLKISDVDRVPDPTILMDFQQKDLKDVLLSNDISLDEPILAINQLKKDIGKPIVNHFRKKGYQIVAPNRSTLADLNLFGKVDLLEYYHLHKYFDFVITGSLHTSIFSIKHNTPFVTLDYSEKTVIDKVESLLGDFNLLNRHIKTKGKDNSEILTKVESCEKKMDKNQVEKRLKFLRNKGFDYIKELEVLLNEKNV